MGKTAFAKRTYITFKYKTKNGWYPRWVQQKLVNKITTQWDKDGVEYKCIPKEEAERLGLGLDLFSRENKQ